ncbi:hypothetical protein K445DRAFT_152827 [Daldinia sp. EC12]|nr:hypothetical protein F4774DRAFT_374279 [Daldinia eschscholtzii]OTB19915.1 hypothetical protein K445DRAFT_152827 [Daldinia sp. EC12]
MKLALHVPQKRSVKIIFGHAYKLLFTYATYAPMIIFAGGECLNGIGTLLANFTHTCPYFLYPVSDQPGRLVPCISWSASIPISPGQGPQTTSSWLHPIAVVRLRHSQVSGFHCIRNASAVIVAILFFI